MDKRQILQQRGYTDGKSVQSLSCVWLFATPWTAALQASLSITISWSSSFSVLTFCLFMLFMGFSRQEYWSGFHSLLQWTTFCQSYPLWPVHWVRQGSGMWSYWLVFCDCGFHSAYSLMEKYKRLMEASWWERLTVGETGSCSDGWGHAQ